MKSLLTDENNDLYLVNFSLAIGEGQQAVAQIVNNVLRTQRGEVDYDTSRGIPYLETVLGDNPDVDLWSSYMIQAIKSIEYVNRVVSFIPKVQENILTYTSRISTIYGDFNINEPV